MDFRCTFELKTRRLLIRLVTLDDIGPLRAILSQQILASVSRDPIDLTSANGPELVALLQEAFARRELLPLVLQRLDDEAIIGWVEAELTINSRERTATIGGWLGQSYRGAGFMTEAVSALIQTLRRSMDVKLFYAQAHVGNPKAINALSRCGFTQRITETPDGNGFRSYVLIETDDTSTAATTD